MLSNEFYEYDAVAGLLAVLLFIFVDVLRIFQYRHGFYLLWRYVVKTICLLTVNKDKRARNRTGWSDGKQCETKHYHW